MTVDDRHPIHKIKAFEIVGPHRLRIEFGDGLVRTIDFRPVLEGELYGPLRDLSQFLLRVTGGRSDHLDPEIPRRDGAAVAASYPRRGGPTRALSVARF